MKLKILMLCLLITNTYAGDPKVYPENFPYLKVATSADNASSFFIGAVGDYAPALQKSGDVLIHNMVLQDRGRNGNPLGQRVESLILVNCDHQVYKIVPYLFQPSKDEPAQLMFPTAASMKKLDLTKEFNSAEPKKVISNSMLSKVTDLGCDYIENMKNHQDHPTMKPKLPKVNV